MSERVPWSVRLLRCLAITATIDRGVGVWVAGTTVNVRTDFRVPSVTLRLGLGGKSRQQQHDSFVSTWYVVFESAC